VRKFFLSKRVIINTVSFRNENSTYFFSRVNEKLFKDDSRFFLNDNDSIFKDNSPRNDREMTKPKIFCPVKQLLLYNENVYGFCLITN
jgi:hypothetical protein